jgi:23S rRNA (pseudouridine1915-N3)-methyltransferase
MQQIRLVCVGRLKEKYYINAAGEYAKRLSSYCRLETDEIAESRVPLKPSQADIDAAMKTEAAAIEGKLLKNSTVVALCIEGTQTDSDGLARMLADLGAQGAGKLSFLIGGSYGLYPDIKDRADIRLSLSRMTFPHHLARIMLLEQLYRAYKILEGGKYHK